MVDWVNNMPRKLYQAGVLPEVAETNRGRRCDLNNFPAVSAAADEANIR